MYNFRAYNDMVYGYVQPVHETIRIEQLGAAETDMQIPDITVIWTAPNPAREGRRCIVGWYLSATVFRHFQNAALPYRLFNNHNIPYNIHTQAANALLLPVDARTLEVPRMEPGSMEQSNVWFAEDNPDFVQRAMEFIGEYRNGGI